MRVQVDAIARDGRTVRIGSEDLWATPVAAEVLEFEAAALSGELVLTVTRRVRVSVGGWLEARAERLCERCGEGVALTVRAEPELVYVPESAEGDEEVELGSGDLDVGWYREGVLDLADVVGEALALALPSRVVCEEVEACDARCADLIERANSVNPAGHPAFAALRNLSR